MQLQCEFVSDSGKHFCFEDCSRPFIKWGLLYTVLFLTTFLAVKGILHPSVDYFYLLLCKVKSPAFYAVAALYLTVSFLAKKFTLERGKYLLSTWGNPLEYEKKLRVNVVNAVGKGVGSLAAITVIVIRRDRSFRVFDSIFCLFLLVKSVAILLADWLAI